MLKSAQDVLASGDVRAIVDFAIEANRTVVSTTAELRVVKLHLRALAEAEKRGNPRLTNVKFEGLTGVAQVVLGKPVPHGRKGMNLRDLRKVLSEELYASLFNEIVQVDVSEDYETNYSQLNPSQRIVVDRYVEFAPPTSRVNLPG